MRLVPKTGQVSSKPGPTGPPLPLTGQHFWACAHPGSRGSEQGPLEWAGQVPAWPEHPGEGMAGPGSRVCPLPWWPGCHAVFGSHYSGLYAQLGALRPCRSAVTLWEITNRLGICRVAGAS